MKVEIDIFDGNRAELGESPIWSVREQVLYWVDSLRGLIMAKAPQDQACRTWDFGEEVGSIGLHVDGGLVVAARSGIYLFDPSSESRSLVSAPECDRPRNRFNDGKVDRCGRLWAGTLQEGRFEPVGNLWSIDADGVARMWVSGVTIPNALCFSPAGDRMYFTDSPTGQLDVFDFDQVSGAVRGRRLLAKVPGAKGLIDGATTDALGRIWCANIDGGRILCFGPDGQLLLALQVPVSRPTCCAFGGPNLDVLYVTTATRRLTAEQREAQPMAGCLMAISGLGAQGVREPEYAGRYRASQVAKLN